MKTQTARILLFTLTLECCGVTRAGLVYNYAGSPVAIPDNNASGAAFSFSLSDPTVAIAEVTVTLNISGGYNGDMYAYLSHGPGFAVLLNRVGVGTTTPGSSSAGYGDSGFAITLSSGAAANVHFYQNNDPLYSNGQLTGQWQPDGRGIDPDSAAAAFDAPRNANFDSFWGANPNGSWTLFFADLSPGGNSTVNGFSVSMSPVPEPVNLALGVFGGLFAAVALCRWWRKGRVPGCASHRCRDVSIRADNGPSPNLTISNLGNSSYAPGGVDGVDAIQS
jgi:subtilisin-like proprotein convertase family protein